MTARFVFIESNTTGTGRLFARAAAQHGFEPLLFTRDASRYDYLSEDRIETLEIDTQNEEDLLQACRDLASGPGLAGVASSSEYFIATAAAIATRLGLPAPHPAAVRTCRDKQQQRRCLQASGCAVAAFRAATSVKTAVAAAETIGFPVVIKPVSGSGSVGVKLCENVAEVATHAAALLLKRSNERGLAMPRRILVESVAEGEEFSVETFSRTVVGVTRKYLSEPPDFVEVGHDYPAAIPLSAEEQIGACALSALDALGLGWGPAHTELRLSQQGPVIIEVNPRLAGGYIPKLVFLASGIDLISETIKLAAGQKPKLEQRWNRHACIRFIVPPAPGVLVQTDGLAEARSVPGVVEAEIYRRPGSELAHQGDFRARIGHVISSHDDLEAARLSVSAAHKAVRLTIQPNRYQ